MMNEGALPELPAGWGWTRLGEVCLYPQYGWTTSAKKEGALHLLRTTDITSGNIDWNIVPFCKEEPSEKEKYLLKDGDIVISRAGSVGYSHLIKNPKEAIFASYLIRFRPLIDEKYLAYFLKSPIYWNSISEKSLGIAIPNVNASKLKQISIPLPPLPEQRAIVSKIEQLFSDLDNGINNFKKAQAQLKRYRQSVLKAACEGKLVPTEAELARAEGREYEHADVLLARILKERSKKWKGKGKFKEPDAPDTSGLPDLPEGWGWATLEQLSWDSGYGTSEKCDYNFSGPPVLRIPNINEGHINLNNIKYASESTNLNETESLVYGDMLVIRTNGSKYLIGRAGTVTQNFNKPYFFASYLIRFRIVEFGGLSIWLSSIWHTLRIRLWIESFAATSAGQYNISMSTLNKLPLELPPLAEQRRIVAEVERRLSVSDKMEATIAESLRQSILKKAFEGKLLNKKELGIARNAPDWEPAEKLLERINAEKVKAQKNKHMSGE